MKQWRRFAFIALACATLFPAAAGAQQLTITSPSAGTVIAPGQTFVVTVSVTSGSVVAVLVSAQDIGATALQATAPYSFSLTIPQGVVGLKNLSAIGVTGAEQGVTSAPVQIDVEPSVQATSLSPSLQQIGFGFAGDQFPLRVTATFADGSQLDVTRSTQITFSSVDATVATVDSTGLVTAVGAGKTSISVTYGGQSTTVQVTVPTKVVGDLNGDGKITADDMRILQAFVGTNAVGAFDARDLNGDGKIDTSDVQVLKNSCGSTCSSIVSITATILASSINPSVSGQSVALTATVSSAGTTTPTGSIVFLDGGAQMGTLNLDSAGNAVFQTATLAAGAHAITAKYGGDANSTSSTSASLTQVVNVPVVTDKTPPVTTAVQSPAPNAAGWNNTNVTITLSSTDNELGGTGVKQIHWSMGGAQSGSSTVSGGTTAVSTSTEGTTTLTYFGTDNAGNHEALKTLTIHIDKTLPSIYGARTPAPNANGWNNTSVSVSFTCADSLSGLALGSPPAPTVLTAEGAGQSVGGTCTDVAGNSAASTVSGINIDKESPVIAASANPATLWPPNGKMVNVTISGTAADNLSGVNPSTAAFTVKDAYGLVQPSGPVSLKSNGTYSFRVSLEARRNGQDKNGRLYRITVSAQDYAGNAASTTATVIVPHDTGN